jgi:hypothetical protein
MKPLIRISHRKNKKYDVDNYMININNDRLQTLIADNSDDGIQAL